MKQKLIKFGKFLLGFFPTRVPVGVTEFEAWVDSFPATYNLPPVDKESLKFILSSAVMHSGPTAAYKPKFHFYLLIMAAAAKQVAGFVFHETKTKRDTAQREAEKASASGTQQQGV